MHQTKKGNQYYFGAKAHIGVDDDSRLVHSVVVTAANVADVTKSTNCYTVLRTWSAPMQAIPVSRSAKSMLDAKSYGRLQPGAAPTRNTENAACCTKQYARSREPKLRFAPG
ncbi:transposase [Pseudomonas sp. W2Oct36]